MNASSEASRRRCRQCGAPLDSGHAAEVCLGCALEHALEPTASPEAASVLPQNATAGSTIARNPLLGRFGDYELLEEIARGGMGVVFKARQVSLDRLVAVKMLLFGPLASAETVQRFRTEAAAAASLQHPKIVAVHEVGFRDGQHFIAMDYVAGRSLAEIVRDGPLPPHRAAGYVKTIAEAIHFAHERNILHRDLKPSNVLIDEHDQPKVSDFGLAKRLEKDTELTLSGQVLGSPNYMPPEQAAAHRGLVGKRSDVYSLGAILYHLLTGRAPFVAATVAETLQQVQNVEPVSPTVLNPHLPRDLKTICLKCLEKEPARRYQTAQELADELGRFLADKPILARPVSRPEKVWRWCRRKPLVASLNAAIVLAILVGFAGVAWQGQRAIQARDVAQRRLYAAQMSQAFRAWDVGNLRPARALLDAQRPLPGETDLRGADWRWLWSLCQGEAKAVLPTQGEMTINAAEPSPDGRWLATAGWSNNVVVYDLTGREQPRVLRGHTRLLTGNRSIAFSPDGRRLASASGGIYVDPGPCELFLWDLATTNKTVLEGHKMWLWAVAFSPDGAWLASASMDGTIGLWDGKTGRNLAILRGHRQPAYALAFSRDGHWLFSGGQDGTVRRWDVAARREVGQPLQQELPVYFVDVAPDARTIAVGCTDHYLRLWDTTSGRVRKLRYSPSEPVYAPVFSPDGRLLAFGTGNNIRVWDLQTEQEKTVLRGSAGRIINLRFLPDGRQLVSANEFDNPMLWDIDRPEKVITLKGFREGARSTAVSSVPSWLAVGSGDESGPERPGEVIVFDLATQQRLLPPLEHPQCVNSVSLTADARLLATGCADGSVRIFTLPDGRLMRTLTNAVANRSGNVIFSPNGQSLITCGGTPAQLAVWNTATWQARALLRNPPANHAGFAFSADGSLLVTPMGENFAIVWNMPSGTTNQVLKFNSYAGTAAFSSDGSMLALALGFFDIELLRVKTWKSLGTFKGHQHVIYRMAFAPDGKILASVAIDGSVRLWSVPGCDEVAVLYDHLDVTGTVAFTPDGQWLISGSNDKTVKLRRLPSFEEIQTAESAAAARSPHP